MKLTEEKSVKIIAKDRGNFTTYSMMVSSKDKDDNWVNGFIECKFKKGVSVANKSKIKINNAFPVVEKWNDKTFVKWMITDFEVVEQGETPQAVATDDFMVIPEGMSEDMEMIFK